jgi:predicted SnoaL-like aldol condensation-catalyzing enzyme
LVSIAGSTIPTVEDGSDGLRVADGRFVEHCDVIRPFPETAANAKEKIMSEANKSVTVAFYKQALLEGDVENAFRAYAGPTYRQHNPLIEDGMEGVRKFIAWIMANHPDAHGEIKRVFADGDYVILHSHWHGLSDNPRGEAVVDIFRLENGKMVEHWDVIQPIPETVANNNTMF